MIARVLSSVGRPGTVGKFREEQIVHRSTWAKIHDPGTTVGPVTTVRVAMFNGTTQTQVNPVDIGSGVDAGSLLDSDAFDDYGPIRQTGRVF